MRAITLIRKCIRRWWMLVTADKDLVRIQGSSQGYYVLRASWTNSNQVTFIGLLGWEHDYSKASVTFPSMQQARKKTIIAKYYIEVME